MTKILIVDDDPELLRLIGIALQRANYQPIVAKDAESALERLRKDQPALVILDIMLPGMSGIELCRTLRSETKTLPLPIIMLSARTQLEDKIAGLEAGADEYLTKPINPREMVARVDALLERMRRLREAAVPESKTIVGFIGAKGGVGTTTVLANVAATMARHALRVVAAEIRPQYGTLAVHLGQRAPYETLRGLLTSHGKQINERTTRMYLSTDNSGLEVLYGPRPDQEHQPLDPEEVDATIQALADLSDIVLLDLPCDFTPATEAALRSCTTVMLVMRPEADSLAAGQAVIASLKALGIGRGVVEAVIVNQVPLAMGINAEQVRDDLGCDIAAVVPPAADACAISVQRRQPLIETQPNNPAANKMKELAARLAEIP
jgi:DNA-binding response OmpR family regulator